ncbi:MAG: tRNA (adenosine(37)-N6)-dimethylallyltransferase MiaA [Muribaculaceae bacterium]
MNTLVVITGATGSGKTSLAIEVAKASGAEIISADSRQFFREIPIGTAAPTPEELAAVPHFFVGTHSLTDYYSAADFEADVLRLLEEKWKTHSTMVMVGGSMMYVDAVVNGIDDLPTISEENRRRAMMVYEEGGLQQLRLDLLEMDPDYYKIVDLNNHKRLIHALEIMYESGKKYSELRTGERRQRDFRILKYAIDLPREVLFSRINARTEQMMASGFLQEAERVYPLRHLNSLNTVGYKELFAYIDGKMDYDTAVARIAKNTRVYAKKQLTWLKKDDSVKFLQPETALMTILKDLGE